MLRIQRNLKNSRRAAFSLAELVISIGVLILMMALAGQVFTITIKSTGQATGLTEVTQQLRVLEETLREDLRNVHPGQSVMVMQGNPVNAFWTQSGKDAAFDQADPSKGYGHARDLEREKLRADGTPEVVNGYELMQEPRADILMFFTARKATSFVNPTVSSRVQQVVYGHADMGEYPTDPTADMTLTADLSTSTSAPFLVPAQQWHLARRSVLVIPTTLDPAIHPGTRIWSHLAIPAAFGLQNKDILDGAVDVVSEFFYDLLVLKPQPDPPSGQYWYLPAIFGDISQPVPQFRPWLRSRMDPTPPMMMANRIGSYFLPNCASFKVEWSLDPRSPFVAGRLDGLSEVFWIDPGDTGDTGRETFTAPDPLYSIQRKIDQLDKNNDDVSGALMIQLQSLLCEQTFHADGDKYSLADRFRGVSCEGYADAEYPPWPRLSGGSNPNLVAFTATRPHVTTGEMVADDVWPGALRITVDLYDRELRLDRPIRHVMVIPIGG